MPSLRNASEVSPTTGWCHGISRFSTSANQLFTASRTAPTEYVPVIITGPPSTPPSITHGAPVISPKPLPANHPANTGAQVLPFGRIAVTPVRTGPLPGTSGPLPSMMVVWPTSTPATSVMAFKGPGVPSNGTPSARARGFCWAITAGASRASTTPATATRKRREESGFISAYLSDRDQCQ